jgi:UDP-N-acetylglucosamine transferase subunit ALG13
MIFVTVGTQLPFDRMVGAVDDWARQRNRTDVFAQVGPTSVRPRHIAFAPFIDTREFQQRVSDAAVVVAHAGMGSILTALELGKPIIVMPRRADLLEHRNDHQMATARQLLSQGRVHVAFDEVELLAKLQQIDSIRAAARISPHASAQLIHTIRQFIISGGVGQRRGQRPPSERALDVALRG